MYPVTWLDAWCVCFVFDMQYFFPLFRQILTFSSKYVKPTWTSFDKTATQISRRYCEIVSTFCWYKLSTTVQLKWIIHFILFRLSTKEVFFGVFFFSAYIYFFNTTTKSFINVTNIVYVLGSLKCRSTIPMFLLWLCFFRKFIMSFF